MRNTERRRRRRTRDRRVPRSARGHRHPIALRLSKPPSPRQRRLRFAGVLRSTIGSTAPITTST
eukprot:269145-Pyramimonas_sp.AAC.1